MATLLVRNGHLLDPDLPFEPAEVLVEDGRIARIGHGLGRADRIVDATGRVVMPGLINTHTHGVQVLDRGLGDGLTLDQWGVFGAFGAQPLSPRDLYALTAWNALALLRGGCTAVMDVSGPTAIFDDGIDAIMQAHLDTGIRATVALTLVDMDFYRTLPPPLMGAEPLPTMPFTRPDAAFHLAAARRFLKAWRDGSPRVRPALGPSAPQRLTDELLAGCFALSEEFDASVHTHLLEARSQWFACRERFGMSAIAYLDRQGWLGPRLSGAHGVWLDDEDMRLLAERGSPLSHAPISNLRLGSGIANVQRLRAAGVHVGIGTDGAASNDGQNMWEALKMTALLHRAYGRREDWVTATDALRMCFEGGATILRQPIGAIRPGHAADLAILGGRDLFLLPKERMTASLVLGELGGSVETVIVAGAVVVEDGRSTRVDETALRAAVAAIVERTASFGEVRAQGYAEGRVRLDRMLAAVEASEDGPPGVVIPGRS